MKAFSFRLEQVLRWRETQVNLQKSRVAVAAGRLADINALLETRRADLINATTRIMDHPTGGALLSFAAFREKAAALIRDGESQALIAQRTLNLEMKSLIEASRKVRLLENLKQGAQAGWQREFDRELAAFADEAFLYRLQSKTERTGA